MIIIFLLPFAVFAKDDDNDIDDDEDVRSTIDLNEHELGDQALGISAGLWVPLFFSDFHGNRRDTNVSVGALASFQWNAYLCSWFRLGAEIAGSFGISPNKKSLLMLPITLKTTFLVKAGRFEFPFSFGFGINLVRYRSMKQVDIILKPAVGMYWYFNSNWSFGMETSWWMDFQPATRIQKDEGNEDHSRFGNYIIINLGVFYHF